ncbi:hypothetical protein WJX77_000337 [Trebouxia sp. C0004]
MVLATMQQSLRVQQAPSRLCGSPLPAPQTAVRSPVTRWSALQQNSNRTQPKVTEVTSDPVMEGPTAAAKCWCGKSKRSCLTYRKSNAHVRFTGAIQAHTVDRTAYSQKVKQGSGNERVLRYPDGRVRCIRYPLTTTDNEIQSDHVDVTVSYEEDWDPDRWDDIDWPWDTASLWEDAGSSTAAVVTPLPSQPAHEFILQQKTRHTFNSPADLLRTLNAAGYMQAQQDLLQEVQNSYEIHTGSPWIQSRPVFVLVQQQAHSDVPVTYTLKTKVSWTAAEDELSKVLKRRRADGSSLIKLDQLQEGIVLFEDVADAEQYSSYMEAETSAQARCAEHLCTSLWFLLVVYRHWTAYTI